MSKQLKQTKSRGTSTSAFIFDDCLQWPSLPEDEFVADTNRILRQMSETEDIIPNRGYDLAVVGNPFNTLAVKPPPMVYGTAPRRVVTDSKENAWAHSADLLNRYFYQTTIIRTYLSKTLCEILYGINGEDLDINIDAAFVNQYVEIDKVNGTVQAKRNLNGKVGVINRYYKPQKGLQHA